MFDIILFSFMLHLNQIAIAIIACGDTLLIFRSPQYIQYYHDNQSFYSYS